jgi:hypothetical protein
MPRPLNERQSLEQELAELRGRIAAHRNELVILVVNKARRDRLEWQIRERSPIRAARENIMQRAANVLARGRRRQTVSNRTGPGAVDRLDVGVRPVGRCPANSTAQTPEHLAFGRPVRRPRGCHPRRRAPSAPTGTGRHMPSQYLEGWSRQRTTPAHPVPKPTPPPRPPAPPTPR